MVSIKPPNSLYSKPAGFSTGPCLWQLDGTAHIRLTALLTAGLVVKQKDLFDGQAEVLGDVVSHRLWAEITPV
jgi:hypothetical protein